MSAVVLPGAPLVDDLDRMSVVRHLDVDETSFLTANRHQPGTREAGAE
jgi:hypothetical protein